MAKVTIRELRNKGSEVVDRVIAGECLTVTRGGRPVAELRPVRRHGIRGSVVLERWSSLPFVDPVSFRRDLDDIVDHSV